MPAKHLAGDRRRARHYRSDVPHALVDADARIERHQHDVEYGRKLPANNVRTPVCIDLQADQRITVEEVAEEQSEQKVDRCRPVRAKAENQNEQGNSKRDEITKRDENVDSRALKEARAQNKGSQLPVDPRPLDTPPRPLEE